MPLSIEVPFLTRDFLSADPRLVELAEEEQNLYKMRDDFALKFQNEEAKLNDEFQKNVKDFIKKQYNIKPKTANELESLDGQICKTNVNP